VDPGPDPGGSKTYGSGSSTLVYTHAQAESSSVRDRMDHLYNNLDMADIHILAVDEVRMTRSPSYNYRTIDLFLIAMADEEILASNIPI
jgi:hypothetical protein